MTANDTAPRFGTVEQIGRYSSTRSRRDAKRALARVRRRNERRAIAAGRWDALPSSSRAFVLGWDD